MSARLLSWMLVVAHIHIFLAGPDPFLDELRREGTCLSPPSLAVIGAGQGTTGTHSLFNEVCAMGYRSIHFGESIYGAILAYLKSGPSHLRYSYARNAMHAA